MLLRTLLGCRCGIALLLKVFRVLLVHVFIDILVFEIVVLVVLVLTGLFLRDPSFFENFLRRHKCCVCFGIRHSRILSERLLRFTRLLVNDHNR